MIMTSTHQYVSGDRVDVPEQVFLGNVVTRSGVGVVKQILRQKFGNATQKLLIVEVDGQGERKYLSKNVRWIGEPE